MKEVSRVAFWGLLYGEFLVLTKLQDRSIEKGLSLKNLLNNRYHKKKPHMASRLFGFPSWQATKEMIDILFPDTIYLGELDEAARQELLDLPFDSEVWPAAKELDNARLKKHHDCVLTLLKLRHNYDIQVLAEVANLNEKTVGQILQTWIPRFGKVGRLLSNLPMPAELNKMLLSEDFVNSPFADVYAVGDAKDIQTEAIRSNSGLNRAQMSSKINAPALRGMTWATGRGFAFIVTDLVLARSTEPAIFEKYGSRFKDAPPDMRLLYDKGIQKMRHATPNLNPIATPSFLRGRDRFTHMEVTDLAGSAFA